MLKSQNFDRVRVPELIVCSPMKYRLDRFPWSATIKAITIRRHDGKASASSFDPPAALPLNKLQNRKFGSISLEHQITKTYNNNILQAIGLDIIALSLQTVHI